VFQVIEIYREQAKDIM